MGGRIYDPTLGRFLQADPFIQSPKNSQNYNRYSYVLNNPLSFTDPSGYNFISNVFKKLNKALGNFAPVFGIALMFIPGMQAWAAQSIWHAAAVGFGIGGVSTGSLKGALIGAFSGAAFHQIGSHFGDKFGKFADATLGQQAQWAGSHAVAGGITSTLSGGKFGHGFFSAGSTKFATSNAGFNYNDTSNGAIAGRVTIAAVIGGTSSAISGGKFANGATTAAMAQLFNAETENLRQRPSYAEMEKNYPKGSADDVFEAVGGKVAINGKIPEDQGGWENSCTVRISVCLNASGAEIPFIPGETSSGANGKWHMFRVRTLEGYLTDNWGAPDILSTNIADFAGQKGIIIFDTTGTWSNASGHATLWNGLTTVDSSNYFDSSKRVMLWKLPE